MGVHNSVKNKIPKNKKIFYLRNYNTSVHAKNQISKSRGIGCRRRTKKSIYQKNGVFFHKTHFFIFFKNCLFTFSIKNYLQKIRFVPLMGFTQSPVQLLEKIKKGPLINEKTKFQKTKKKNIVFPQS